jgi:hypothetical protein
MVAVGLRGDESLRLIDAATGDLDYRDIPSSGFVPIALAWNPGGASLYVLTMCNLGCTPTRLDLLQHHVTAGSWEQLRSWSTVLDTGDQATLELIGTEYVAVGPVRRTVLLVPLNGDGETRALLGEGAFRASRRP